MTEPPESDNRRLLAATMSGALITPLLSTMMNLAMVSIGDEFSVGSHDLGYLNTAFLLGSVMAMVPIGRYCGITGMRRMFTAGLVTVLAASLLSMVSPDYGFLVAMRFLTGVGGSALMVTSMAMISIAFPMDRRGWAIGMNTTSVYVGLSLGPSLGGVITDMAGWRFLYVIPVMLCFIALLTMGRFKREFRPTAEERMDWVGSAMWGTAILLMTFGAVNITEPTALPLLVGGAVLMIVTISHLSRCDSPVLNTKLFRDRSFSCSCTAAFMNYAATYSVAFFLALYLQSIGRMTAMEAGMLMLTQPVIQVLLTARFGALSDRMSDKRVLPSLGMVFAALGVSGMLLMDEDFSLPLVIGTMALFGMGTAMFSSPNTSVIMSAPPPELRGEASAMVAVVRQTGMICSMAASMAVISAVMGSADNLVPETYGDFVTVMSILFSMCLVMCVSGVVTSWFGGQKCPCDGDLGQD